VRWERVNAIHVPIRLRGGRKIHGEGQ
jgi:hypothetical protein